MAGYSGTPLPQKLGIKQGARVAFVNAPDGFAATLGALPTGVTVSSAKAGAKLRGPLEVVVLFITTRASLEKQLPALEQALHPDGGLWIAWPKKASGVKTDVTEGTLREVCLPRGLVDNKVCAIDETWSGLRLVVRKEKRAAWPPQR